MSYTFSLVFQSTTKTLMQQQWSGVLITQTVCRRYRRWVVFSVLGGMNSPGEAHHLLSSACLLTPTATHTNDESNSTLGEFQHEKLIEFSFYMNCVCTSTSCSVLQSFLLFVFTQCFYSPHPPRWMTWRLSIWQTDYLSGQPTRWLAVWWLSGWLAVWPTDWLALPP